MFKPARRRVAKFALAFSLPCSLLFSLPLFAQDAADSENTELEEVIVTASRREESLQDVAISVAVLDVGDYIDAGYTNLADILPQVPGVSIVGAGGNFGNAVYIRGINAVLAAGVTSYIDEIPFGSSTVYTTPAILDGTLLDLDNMSVLKGPQGTLYGASALGGLLRFDTRDASMDKWTGSVSANLSDTHGGGLNQLYRVNANGPIATDTLALSFTAFYSDEAGYIDNVTIPKKGWDSSEYYGGSGSLRWTPTEKLEIKLQGLYQKSTQEGLATIQAYPAPAQPPFLDQLPDGTPVYGKYETGEVDINPSEFEADLLGLTINYDFDWGVFSSITSTQEQTFVQTTDLTIPYAFFADIFFPNNAPHTSALFVGDLGFEKITQELRLVSASTKKFEWIVGAYYTEEDGHNIQELVLTPPDDLFFANFPSTYEEYSLYGTGTWYFTPDFDASVGVRYADYSNNVELQAKGPLVAPIGLTEIEDDVTNWLFNTRYRASENMSLYGRIASGYRPGGANFVLLDQGGNPLTEAFFEPDSLWSYEVGLKGNSDDGRFGYDVSAFYIDWQDYQINVVIAGLSVAGNADKAVSKGFEGSLSYAVTDAFTLTGTLGYINAEVAGDEPNLGAPDGTQLPNSPEWAATLGAQYDFDLSGHPAYVGATWQYKGDMPVGFPGYTDSNGTYWPPSAPRVTVDSYNLFDMRAGMDFDHFTLSVYGTNLFDEWAYTSFGPSFSAASLGTPTRPRTLGIAAQWNFR
jgi:iron complex outermembrane receptor protein